MDLSLFHLDEVTDMDIKIKRVYEEPSDADGMRILVDRMWPREIKKENLLMDSWEKGLAPMSDLRKWYSHDPAKYDEFRKRYFAELDTSSESEDFVSRISAYDGTVTLLFSAKDTQHSNAYVLKEWIEKRHHQNV